MTAPACTDRERPRDWMFRTVTSRKPLSSTQVDHPLSSYFPSTGASERAVARASLCLWHCSRISKQRCKKDWSLNRSPHSTAAAGITISAITISHYLQRSYSVLSPTFTLHLQSPISVGPPLDELQRTSARFLSFSTSRFRKSWSFHFVW